jgi:drug/metabolite transporter (DMT)-like permease
MHIIVDTQPDPALWRAAFRQVLRKSMRRVRILGAILAAIGLLLVLLAAATGGDDAAPLIFGIFLIVLGALYALYLPVRALQLSVRRLPPALQQPLRIELTEQYVEVTSPLIFTRYAWGAFVRIQEAPGLLMLMLSRNQTLPVPLGGLPPEDLARLRYFVANRQFVLR